MTLFDAFFKEPKNRKFAIILALLGTIFPVAGLHKLYLGQYLWGIIYFLLRFSPWSNFDLLLQSACAFEGIWYLMQSPEAFNLRFNQGIGLEGVNQASLATQQIRELGQALQTLEKLRQDGLISELEFEQKRRKLIDN
jgi:TM2 domain-containing membrane protein YozV